MINLSFRNNGIITTFDLKLGQSVKKGQLLGMLDNVQSRLSYESTIASLNSAASQMNTAKLSLNRIRSLYEKGSSSLSDYEAIKNSYRTAVASHESVKRSVAIQEEKIRYGYLYAPEDGVIAQIHVEMDENVNTGQRIAVLNAGTDMEISLGLPENIINLVQQNMSVKVTFSSLANLVFDGVISEVSPAVSQSSAIYPIRVRIVKPTNDIKSGMAADVTFNFRKTTESENVIVIPAKAVGEDAQGNFVFVIEKDGNGSTIVKRQMVSVGKLSSQGFEIIEGLFIGQKIAVAGLQTLLEGQEVKMNVRSGLPEDR
ncbi:MAG: efflux RND transporter periplasmic adaptor subunit [Flavobacteriaceae bacterium]|nr:efflux RND transporter periplasmic adaptor subunit [Flavobacteriaceae bacterium]